MDGLALIIGCARSGTSILGELVASHPDVNYIWEAHKIWEIAGHGVDGCQRLTERHATPEVRERIREWFAQQAVPGKLSVEKNPRNVLRVPYVRALFPGVRLIHIVRDGRDVACSLVPGAGGREWLHLKPPGWRRLDEQYEGAVRCGLAWKEIVEIALADLQQVPHLQVRYEDLVAEPWTVAQRILAYLGLTEAKAVQDFCRNIQNRTAHSYHARYQSTWYRDNHSVRIGRWRENLSKEEKLILSEELAPLLSRLGYQV